MSWGSSCKRKRIWSIDDGLFCNFRQSDLIGVGDQRRGILTILTNNGSGGFGSNATLIFGINYSPRQA
jgi:hypothetical protein